MLFDDRKLETADLAHMLSCPVDTIDAYSFLLAPAYIYMRKNDRVISVKAPLDFFTPEELVKLKTYGVVYFPPFVKSPVQFQTAGRVLKKMLSREDVKFPRATFELMKEVSLMVSDLWFSNLQVEPFFAAVFAQELCEPIDPKVLLRAREEAVMLHDHALLLSGLFVFVAVQLGWIDLAELSQIRKSIYERTIACENWSQPKSEADAVVADLHQIIQEKKALGIQDLADFSTEWAAQLKARLKGWSARLSTRPERAPSIYGPNGFLPEGSAA